jgi:acyl carrier protein
MSDVEAVVREAVLEVLRTNGSGKASVTSEHSLIVDLGLSSLDLARLIAILELRLQADPFSHDIAIATVHTISDLCQAYAFARNRQTTAQ